MKFRFKRRSPSGQNGLGGWFLLASAIGTWAFALTAEVEGKPNSPQATGSYTVLAYNDLGMHCMGNRFGEICILPPANTMRATVIRRGDEPHIVTSGVQVTFSIPGNTISTTKTDFWTYAPALFGVNLAPNMGLFGYGLSGQMGTTTDRDWIAQGVPLTPIQDDGIENAYQLAAVSVKSGATALASTLAVMPVSWEMHCDYCHNTRGITTETDILRKHDRKHGTHLEQQKPVLCARCHADNALGAVGDPTVSNLSQAMHSSHANRFTKFGIIEDLSLVPIGKTPRLIGPRITLPNKCYACHPGTKTQCLRDMHSASGEACVTCHGDMATVGNPTRKPWIDLPKCSSCHHVAGHDYEEPGKLYRDSKGHGGVKCEACHGSPHAIFPTKVAADNVQSTNLQGHAGKIDTCTVCHTSTPKDRFFHKISD